MFFIAGITITFFLVLLLIGKKGRTPADGILAGWLFCLGLHLLLFYLFFSEKIYAFPFLLGVGIPLPLVHGPFLYLYTSALTGRLPKTLPGRLVHFVPALLSYGYMVPFFLMPADRKVYIFKHEGQGFETFLAVNLGAIFVSGVTYVLLSFMALRRHRKTIRHLFSYEERISLGWLRYLIYGIAVIWVMVFLGNETAIFASTVLFVFFMGYFGIRQAGIFTVKPAADNDHASAPAVLPVNIHDGEPMPEIPAEAVTDEPDGPKKKYRKSGLTPEAVDKISAGLQGLMETEKLYKDNELTLNTLALRLNVHPNYVSQVINHKEGKNFYDYINGLRIAEYIRLASLPENHKYTILYLATECGFNSKSSFNKYFKKVTGVSPTDYGRQ